MRLWRSKPQVSPSEVLEEMLDAVKSQPRRDLPAEDEIKLRLRSRVTTDGSPTFAGEPCWIWTRGRLRSGYGMVCYQGKTQLAHRLSYTLFAGDIPEGLQLDHLCRNRTCINPAHLEPVTARVNTMRSKAPAARNARATHCKRGHAFTDRNTYVTSGGSRVCRTCVAALRRAKRAGLTVDEVLEKDLRQRRIKRDARKPSTISGRDWRLQ